MKIRSIKFNYILNLFRALSGGLVTIAVMPHVNRVLGPETVGKVEYIYTIANYFVLFSAIGIPMYGVREIAKVRENEVERVRVAAELLLILAITTVISYLFYFGIIYQLASFENYKSLLLVMSAMILLSNLGAEWYFQGIEDQLYITIRYVIVRVLAVVLVFFGITNEQDYLVYGVVLVLTLCGSGIFNFFYLAKILQINRKSLSNLNFRRHLKPVLTIFFAAISINIYLQLDNFLIGFLVGDKYVGYYSVANKLIRFSISFITIIGAVLLPRLSNLYINDHAQYIVLLKKAFSIILIASIPTSFIFMFYSKELIGYMAGPNFTESVLTMEILSPLCIVVGLAYFFGYLVLYPQNKEAIYTKAVVVSALFSVLVNFFAIKYYFQNGAAVIAVISEVIAILIMIFMAREEISKAQLIDKNLLKIIAASALVFVFIQVIDFSIDLTNLFILMSILASVYIVFVGGLFFMKEKTVFEIVSKALARLKSSKINA